MRSTAARIPLLAACLLLAACFGSGDSPGGGNGQSPDGQENASPDPVPADDGNGAAEPDPEPDPEPEPEPVEPEPENGAENGEQDPTPDPAGDLPFTELLAKIEGLREAGEFNDAYLLCQKNRTSYATAENRRLIALARDLRDYKRDAVKVETALKQLAGGNATTRRIAYQQLLSYGQATVIVLRNALPEAGGAKATYMADILAQYKDRRSFLPIARKMRTAEDPERAADLRRSLERLAPACGPEELGALFAEVVSARRIEDHALAEVFLAAHAEGGDVAALTGREDAVTELKAYVKAANDSADSEAVLWSRRHADFAGLSQPGWKWEYWTNTDLSGEPAQVRRAERIAYGIEDFPRPENVSCRWTGDLIIAEAGTYTFSATSDDGNRVWLDGEKIIDDWSMHGMEETTAEVELQPGKHPIRVEFMQGGGGAGIYLKWIPPGAEKKTVIGPEHVSTMPFEESR